MAMNIESAVASRESRAHQPRLVTRDSGLQVLPGGARSRRSKRPLDLFHSERLDPVADLEVVEVLNTNTALETFAPLADVILEALEAGQGPGVHRAAVAGNPRLGGPLNGAAADHT